MIRVVVISVMFFACSFEEEPSSGIAVSSWAEENSQVGDATISFERADVNEDGVIDIRDLTAISYWFGEEGKAHSVERGISSDLLTNSTIEVGNPFELIVNSDLGMGMVWPQEFSPDFAKGGSYDETCKITVELQGIDAGGQVVDKAIVGKMFPDLDTDIYQPDVDIPGNAPYYAKVTGYFTDSALEGGVERLVVKSGSICRDKTVQPQTVRELTVNIIQRSDDREVEVTVSDNGMLAVNFAPQPDPTKGFGLKVMVVGEDRLLHGYFNSAYGVYHRAYGSNSNRKRAGFRNGDTGSTYQNGELTYQIYHFKQLSELGDGASEVCVEGDRVFVFLSQWGENSNGMNTMIAGSERLYESDCSSN